MKSLNNRIEVTPLQADLLRQANIEPDVIEAVPDTPEAKAFIKAMYELGANMFGPAAGVVKAATGVRINDKFGRGLAKHAPRLAAYKFRFHKGKIKTATPGSNIRKAADHLAIITNDRGEIDRPGIYSSLGDCKNSDGKPSFNSNQITRLPDQLLNKGILEDITPRTSSS